MAEPKEKNQKKSIRKVGEIVTERQNPRLRTRDGEPPSVGDRKGYGGLGGGARMIVAAVASQPDNTKNTRKLERKFGSLLGAGLKKLGRGRVRGKGSNCNPWGEKKRGRAGDSSLVRSKTRSTRKKTDLDGRKNLQGTRWNKETRGAGRRGTQHLPAGG